MENVKRVDLQKIIDHLGLKVEYTPADPSEIMIESTEVNRPGLALSGFFEHFDTFRLQIIGKAEDMLLRRMSPTDMRQHMYEFFEKKPVCVIVAHGIEVLKEGVEIAEYFGVPILTSEENTSDLMASLIAYLHLQLAPGITRHGVLVEVYGEGVYITGDSGVGKSETAIELIKRGHRLIADDAVELRRVSDKTIVGQAPEIIRYYVELRGIGVVDVRRLFGMGSVKETEKIDMVINLEPWQDEKSYANLGLETQYTDIMGIKIPTTTIPVKPGRNLAVVIEIAAMNNRQKKMGYNTAEEFNARLMENMQKNTEKQDEKYNI